MTENNRERSTASGLLASMMSLSGVAGPVIAAGIYLIWPGYAPIMYFAAIMSLIAYGIFWFASRFDSVELIDNELIELV